MGLGVGEERVGAARCGRDTTHHTYEKEGRYFSPKPQHEGVPNMNDKGRLSANTGITAHSDTKPTTLPRIPSGVVPGIVDVMECAAGGGGQV